MSTRAGMSDLITQLRALANDAWKLRQDTATGDGSTKLYWLNHKPDKTGGTVALGGTVQGTSNYTWDLTHGRLEMTSAPGNALALTVEYQAADFSDEEIEGFLDGAMELIEGVAITWLPNTSAASDTEYLRCRTPWRDLEGTASGTAIWALRDSAGAIISGFTLDATTGLFTFSTDQGGSAYYLTARSYDLYRAAADICLRRQAMYSDWYQFDGDGQKFARQQAFEHAEKMEKLMRSQTGRNRQQGAVRSNQFVRVDISPGGQG